MDMSKVRCHSCGGTVREITDYQFLRRVTSDCKPLSAGGRKGVCVCCYLAQSIITEDWKRACHEIYTNYTVYYQGNGIEQLVFSPGSSLGAARSEKILEGTMRAHQLPSRGKALDVGCGNGNFLKAFSAAYPDWNLAGCEYNDNYREDVLSIPAVESFFVGGIDGITEHYDFISLIHVLEHIENPIMFLKNVSSLLTASGVLLIEVPFFSDNPFELLIADHASHFDENSMRGVLSSAGFDILMISSQVVLKEITVLAVRRDQFPADAEPHVVKTDSLSTAVQNILNFRERAMDLRRSAEGLAVFGTSIGGTWLCSELDNNIDFFVDEDKGRIGRKHMGKHILPLHKCPMETALCVPLARCVADSLSSRVPMLKTPPLFL